MLPQAVQDIFSCYSLAAKNIRNKTLFCISNIQSAYIFNKETNSYSLKDKLHDNEKSMISNANQVVYLLNSLSINKKEKSNTDEVNKINNREKKSKSSKLLKEFTDTIDKSTFYQSLDKTFIENLIRYIEDNPSDIKNKDNFKDYTIINSILAQNVVHNVCDDFKHFYSSLSSYFKNQDGFSAMPRKPFYKSKHELSSFEVSASRLNKNGSVLTINKNHRLFLDYKKQKPLNDKAIIDFYNNFDFKSLIEKDIDIKELRNKYSKELKVTLLRVIPLKYSKNKFKLQYTISFPMELKGDYTEIIKNNPKFLKEKDTVKYKIIKDYIRKQVEETKSIPCFASMDLGHVNIASIYYFKGLDNIGLEKSDIISAKNLTSRLNKLDNKIDKVKSNFYNPQNKTDQLILDVLKKIENNRLIKEFNHNLTINPVFGVNPKPVELISKQEQRLLIEHSKRIYEDKLIGKLTYRKSNIIKDYLHKLSSQIVNNLVEKGINLLIIGKNKGWKKEINIGASNNRRAYNLPHSRLIELLKYKCILKNILIIEQEESYTSKTSFASNEELKEYRKENKTQGKKSPLSSHVSSNYVREGQKLYAIKEGKKKLICHADINGAMNIVRKVIPEFNIETIRSASKKHEDKEQIKKIYNYRIVCLSNYSINTIKKSLFAEIKI